MVSLPSTPSSSRAPAAEDQAPAAVGGAAHVVSPLHVLLLGGAALGSGAAITASLTYKEAGRRLRADGIDPAARRAVLPLALRAAAGSLALTACAAAGGFWLLRELGAVEDAPAALPSAGEAWRALRGGGGSRGGGGGGGGAGSGGSTASSSASAVGDGSTIRALSAAWQRRARAAGGEGREEVMQREQEREDAAAPDAAMQTSAWWWWRQRGRRRDEQGASPRAVD